MSELQRNLPAAAPDARLPDVLSHWILLILLLLPFYMLYGIIIFLKKDGVMIFRIISSAHNCQMTKRTIIVVRIFRIGEIFPPEFTKFGIFWKKVSRCRGVLQSQIFEILQRQKYRESNLPLCLGNNTIYIYFYYRRHENCAKTRKENM